MPVHSMGALRLISSSSAPKGSGRQLIITSHGMTTGTTFVPPPAYMGKILFSAAKNEALIAALKSVLTGRIGAQEGAFDPLDAQETCPDYQLSWFEHDPSDAEIQTLLGDKPMDVLRISSVGGTVTLSQVIKTLAQRGLDYDLVNCVFCRVTRSQIRMKLVLPRHGNRTPAGFEKQMQHIVNRTAMLAQIKAKG